MVSVDKKYKTRSGREVTILSVAGDKDWGNSLFPVIGRVEGPSYHKDNLMHWTPDGYFTSNKVTHSCDLVEVTE